MRSLAVFIVLYFGVLTCGYALPTATITKYDVQGYFVTVSYRITNWSIEDNTMTMCGYANPQCVIQVEGSRFSNPIAYITVDTADSDRSVGLTLGQLLVRLNRVGFNIPFNGQFRMSNSIVGPGCTSMTLGLQRSGANRQVISASCADGQVPMRCDIDGNTMISHGALSDSALNGSLASTQLFIKCNNSTTVTVTATRTDSYGVRLRADGSLYAAVKVNDRDATGGINVLATSNESSPINITSTLVTRGTVAAGAFSGSTVITISPN